MAPNALTTSTLRPRVGRLLAVAGATALVVGLAACGGSASSGAANTASAGSTSLVAAWTGDSNSMDPLQAAVIQNRELAVNLYSPLVQYATAKAANGTDVWTGPDLTPALATSWTTSGAVVTFTLRSGVKFYPSGDVMTADDVYYTFQRALEDTNGYGAFNLNLAGLFTASQLKVVDPSHIQFTFEAVKGGPPTLLPVALDTLRYPQFGILDSKVMKAHTTSSDPWADKYIQNNAVGSGPYYVVSHIAGQQLELKASPSYWGTAPHYTTVTLRDVGSADVTALLKSGEVQYAGSGISTKEFQDLKSSGFQVLNEPVPNQMRMEMATDWGNLKNIKVRQAIAYAIPYDQILQTAFSGQKTRSYSYDNPEAPDYQAAWNIYSTNLTKAKQLMSEAGVSGFDVPLYYDSGVTYNQDVALIIESALSQIGVKVTLHAEPTAQFAADSSAREEGKTSSQTGLMFYTDSWWLDNAGPSTDTWIKTGGIGNWSRYDDPQVNAIHAKYYTSASPDRNAEYQKLQTLVAQDAPIVPLVVVGRTVATVKGISGDLVTPDGLSRFWSLS